jgi:hypothetical protein
MQTKTVSETINEQHSMMANTTDPEDVMNDLKSFDSGQVMFERPGREVLFLRGRFQF